jgi:hypothetical protein
VKALLWKELHDNAKWGILLLLLVCGIVATGCWSCGITERFLSHVTFVSAVSGCAWGLWQTVFDTQGDRRAYLLHRPLSASWILAGKTLTGGGLYLAAMILPWSIYSLWAAVPGHLPAPFCWQDLLPWLADILTGLVYYWAGILMGVRPGRWYGSRCLGIAAALLCTFVVWNVPEFWHAVVAILTIGGMIAVAAWGSFVSAGDLDRQPRPAKAALACTYLIGLMVVSVEVKVIAESLLVPADVHRNPKSGIWDRDGQLIVVDELGINGYRLTDVAGRELRRQIGSSVDLALLRAPSGSWGGRFSPTYRTMGRHCIPVIGHSLLAGEKWYYLPNEGRVVGYDCANNRFLGSLGPDGFAPPEMQPASRFTEELSVQISIRRVLQVVFLAFPHEVYSVDVQARSVKRLFVAVDGETVSWACPLTEGGEPATQMQVIIVTDRSVRVVNGSGRESLAAPLAFGTERHGNIAVYRFGNPQRWGVAYAPSLHLGMIQRQTLPTHMLEYDTTGREIARTDLPPRHFFLPSKRQPAFGAVTSPAEAAVLLWALSDSLFGPRPDSVREISQFSSMLFTIVGKVIPDPLELKLERPGKRLLLFGALMLTTAAICAALCLVLSHRLAFSHWRCLAWGLFGLLFGPIGVLLMVAVHDWPARISCPKCRSLRIVNRDTCEHCGAPHAPAPPDGTEIWEPVLNESQQLIVKA